MARFSLDVLSEQDTDITNTELVSTQWRVQGGGALPARAP